MLNIDIEPVRGVLFIKLSGVLERSTVNRFDNEVISFLGKMGVKNIILSMDELTGIDKYGKRALARAFRICRVNKGEFFICVGNNKKILEILDTLKVKIVEDELTAFSLITC